MRGFLFIAAAAAAAAGCASYSWRPRVPPDMRTASVAVFSNESSVTSLGDETARQLLRELQREGTFRIAAPDEAAVEVQGTVSAGSPKVLAYERRTGARLREHELEASAKVSVIDRRSGTVLADSVKYTARATFVCADDVLTGARDASRRLAEDLARQIADDLTSWNFNGGKKDE